MERACGARTRPAALAACAIIALFVCLLQTGGSGGTRATRPRDAVADKAFSRAVHAPPPPPCSAAAASRVCAPGTFLRYEPSALESEWLAGGDVWAADVCGKLAEPAQRASAQAWLDAARATQGDASAPLQSGGAMKRVLSHLVFAGDTAGSEARVAVHPLAGLMRDPRPVCPQLNLEPLGATWIVTTAHLVLDPLAFALARKAVAAAPERRAILIDAGSTAWRTPPPQGAAPGDPIVGLEWLVNAYASRGVTFDDIFAWEATQKPASTYFAGMPPAIVAATHFYNVPVDAERNSAHNPIELLKSVSTPADFVVFKLDIDTEALEEALVLQLLEDDVAAALVDVLYFEHHTSVPAMRPYWGDVDRRSHNDSASLFAALRRRGIQAQSWP